MNLKDIKPSKNVQQPSAYAEALAEYWFIETDRWMRKKKLGPLDPGTVYEPDKKDPVMTDPELPKKVRKFQDMKKRAKAWFEEAEKNGLY